jgi:hypothetical protein
MPLPVRTYDRTVNAELERVLYQIDVIKQECIGLLDGINEEQFNWPPAPGAWSIGQCLGHLNATNRAFLPLMEDAIRKAREQGLTGDGPYTYNWLSRYFFRLVQPPVRMKFKAPKSLHAPPRLNIAEVRKEWDETHARIEQAVRSANGVDLQRAKMVSLIGSLIKYNLGMGFWIQTGHDRRHLSQARQVRNHADFPR